MHPPVDQARFATIERGVELVMERNFANAAPMVAASVEGIKPRLVFGQSMLTEALRVQRARLSAPLLECAKLLAFRRNLGELLRFGPSQLVFEAIEPDERLRCAVSAIDTGRRWSEVYLPADALAEVNATQHAFEQLYPALFARPYVSATRYLFGAH
jgi:hypothetical protein